ncbi:MAG: tRNA preQ1(34) S-adenosylmethionine ribosyltransferase-isomerase QueA [Desulfobacteraceae bacterium]|nr:tRNA preQ1(34) S-adenosylmethionine ribosyltransferase-isomerase QueA [Desulfobacteraceae bacterium]
MYEIEAYNYDLPQDLIAQVPAPKRDHSKLLVVERSSASFSDNQFFDLPSMLQPGDLLVVNNTKVVPARIFGHKESGGRVEILVLEHPDSRNDRDSRKNGDLKKEGSATRLCLLRSSRRPKRGSLLFFDSGVSGEVKALLGDGLVRISFKGDRGIDTLLVEKGFMPLPPYIKRGKKSALSDLDKERYQTVYSEREGAVAAPTAGLHFTTDLLKRLRARGISTVSLTLHVGHGTFRPVKTKDIRQHRLGHEYYLIEPETAAQINETKKNGGRVVAVGTTVVRALESASATDGSLLPGAGKTDLLITPGFVFNVVDVLITNFHLPRSSLLFLVSAFAGLDLIKRAYERAVEKRYRFYSYGDAMLIL